MADTKLFENWQIKEELPNPFRREVENRNGIRYSTDAADCSVYNSLTRGKKATLYPAVLYAVMALIQTENGMDYVAAGMQLNKQEKAQYYCLEYEASQERCAVVYNPRNGKLYGGNLFQPELLTVLPDVQKGVSNGEEFFALFAYASIAQKSSFYNEEFAQNYKVIKEQYEQNWTDKDAVMHAAFVCCDNLFWRIENGDSLGNNGIPFDKESFAAGSVELLTYQKIQSGIYSPNEVTIGTFRIFEKTERQAEYEIAQLQTQHNRTYPYPDSIRRLIPTLPDSFKAGAHVVKILNMIKKTPVRTFLLTGSAGIGKSTDAKIIAQVLGMPYYFFTCGPNTDEMELTASMVPNATRTTAKSREFPSF